MIQKVVKKGRIHDLQSAKQDLDYWLSRPPQERIAAVEYLRKQYNGNTERLQRVVKIIKFK
jgi:hypothetical protein